MTVLDVISILHDDTQAVIYDSAWNVIAEYNGKDSLSKVFNKMKVVRLIPHMDGKLAIEIAE